MLRIVIVGLVIFLIQILELNCQQQYVITLLLLDNGTLVPVARPPAPPSYTLSTKVIAGLFLFLIFFITFAGNVILISTIGSSLTLKRIPHNILLLQLGICGLFEVVLNVSMSTAYLLTQPWRLTRYEFFGVPEKINSCILFIELCAK